MAGRGPAPKSFAEQVADLAAKRTQESEGKRQESSPAPEPPAGLKVLGSALWRSVLAATISRLSRPPRWCGATAWGWI